MKTIKSKRALAFDAKRAARFEARGVRVDNITGATVGLLGKADASCTLCDHAILWQYVLHLSMEGKTTETFEPVGSSCIQSWADSLPHSEAQAKILAALKLAVEEANVIKARFRAINALVKREKLAEVQGRALVAFYSGPPSIRDNIFLADVAYKAVDNGGFVGRQWETWERALDRAFVAFDSRDEIRAFIARAQAAIDSGRVEASPRGDTLLDILGKLEKFDAFYSDRQKSFFIALLEEAEALEVEPTQDEFAFGANTTDYDEKELPL